MELAVNIWGRTGSCCPGTASPCLEPFWGFSSWEREKFSHFPGLGAGSPSGILQGHRRDGTAAGQSGQHQQLPGRDRDRAGTELWRRAGAVWTPEAKQTRFSQGWDCLSCLWKQTRFSLLRHWVMGAATAETSWKAMSEEKEKQWERKGKSSEWAKASGSTWGVRRRKGFGSPVLLSQAAQRLRGKYKVCWEEQLEANQAAEYRTTLVPALTPVFTTGSATRCRICFESLNILQWEYCSYC